MGALFLLLILSPTIDRYIQGRVSDSKAEKEIQNESSPSESNKSEETEN